jgi:hypothetical protein
MASSTSLTMMSKNNESEAAAANWPLQPRRVKKGCSALRNSSFYWMAAGLLFSLFCYGICDTNSPASEAAAAAEAFFLSFMSLNGRFILSQTAYNSSTSFVEISPLNCASSIVRLTETRYIRNKSVPRHCLRRSRLNLAVQWELLWFLICF